MLEYSVTAKRLDHHGSLVKCKKAEIILDTDLNGRQDAFNPAELLLASLSACIIKNIERVVPIIKFHLSGVTVKIKGIRQDKPPQMKRIEYQITVDTNESDKRLSLLHLNVQKYGTVYNTLLSGCELSGTMSRTQ